MVHTPRLIEGNYIVIHQLNDFFSHVAEMLLEYFDTPAYKDVFFDLGGYIHIPASEHRKKFPNHKIIAYQLEQMMGCGNWNSMRRILDHLKEFDEIWDYDDLNVGFLKYYGLTVTKVLPMLYTESLNKISSKEDPEIDVLFYGLLNERRWKIMDNIQARSYGSLKIVWSYGDFNVDKYIANSKVILNIHAFEPWNRQEQVRMFYPVINGKTVISEISQANRMEGLIIESEIKDIAAALKTTCSTDLWKTFGKHAQADFKRKSLEKISNFL